jgi:hypothetical protein
MRGGVFPDRLTALSRSLSHALKHTTFHSTGVQRASDCTAAVAALNVQLLLFGMATFDAGVSCSLTNATIGLCHAANNEATARAAYKAVCAEGACVARANNETLCLPWSTPPP